MPIYFCDDILYKANNIILPFHTNFILNKLQLNYLRKHNLIYLF